MSTTKAKSGKSKAIGASRAQLDELKDKIASNRAFRRRFYRDPVGAAREERIRFSERQAAYIKGELSMLNQTAAGKLEPKIATILSVIP